MKKVLILCLLTVSSWLLAQEAQWRGPERNGIFSGADLLKQWPADGPELLFTIEGLGKGHSSVVVSEGLIYTSGMINNEDVVSCVSDEGEILWQQSYGEAWDQSFPESRCTPLVVDNKVYVLSSKDNLVCFDKMSGDKIWQVDIHASYGSVWDMFGVSESLLLVDDMIIVTPCGKETTVLALDKNTGSRIWQSESLGIERSNGSPVLFENDSMNLRQIIAMNRSHVLGVDPKSGEICWTYHYNKYDKNGDNSTILANSPLFHKDDIFISNGWDVPSVMLEVAPDGQSVNLKYQDNTLDNQNHGLIRVGEFVYGSNFLSRQFGKWTCMRWETGEIMWVEEWETKGPVIYADSLFYILDEKKGNMALAKANPDKLEIISTFKIKGGRGPFWARPAIYNDKLFVRHGDVLLVYKLKEKA